MPTPPSFPPDSWEPPTPERFVLIFFKRKARQPLWVGGGRNGAARRSPALGGAGSPLTPTWPLPQGFEGATCENDARSCGSLRCLNGGTCIAGPRSPTCLCLGPFTGPECQFPASSPCVGSNPCYNQGVCEPTAESPFYRCRCPAKFNGLLCHILDYSFGGGVGLDIPPPQIEETCELPGCREEAGNKVCSLQCNSHACGWDGGDCSLDFDDPWQNCTQSLQCWKYFSNGRCDSQCNSAGCLFDGFDCQRAEGQCK